MSFKSTLDGLLQLLLRSLCEYILKRLFFEILVNSGRIFTEARFQRIIIVKYLSHLVNWMAQSIEHWAAVWEIVSSSLARPTLRVLKELRRRCCLCNYI